MSERLIPNTSEGGVVTYTLLSEGNVLSGEWQVLGIYVTKAVNQVSSAKIIIRDGDPAAEDFPNSNSDFFAPGKKIEVQVGYSSDEQTLFKGIVIKNNVSIKRSGATVFTVVCKDESVKLTIGRKNKIFEEKKDSDIIEGVISENSLSTDVDSTTVTHPELVQFNSTDWDFIVTRAEANGMLVMPEDDKLTVKKPDFSQSEAVTVIYGATMLEFDGEIDASDQLDSVKSQAWDYTGQALIEKNGSEPSYSGPGDLAPKKLAEVLGGSEVELRHTGQVADVELKSWADAQLLKSRLAKVKGRVKFQGFAAVKPGNLIELEGVGKRFNGKVFVAGVRHEVNDGNWLTNVQFGLPFKWFVERHTDVNEMPAAGLLPSVRGMQIGVVTQLEGDPNGENRILVKIPIVDERSNGIWARVATLYAGAERGSFFLPEIGDEVILGFLNDDPRDAIVIGAVHSSANPAPEEATDDNFIKGIVTNSQMKLLFDDEKSIVTLETPGGNKFVVDDDQGSITLEDQNGNKLVMDDSGIIMESAKDITLKATGKITHQASQDMTIEGMNVNIKADAQFKAEGAAGAEVSTSGQAVLKGSMVMIN